MFVSWGNLFLDQYENESVNNKKNNKEVTLATMGDQLETDRHSTLQR